MFCSKNTQHCKKYTPAIQPKSLFTLQIFQQTCLWLMSDKVFPLHHFGKPKNCILEELGKQKFVYSVISPSENFCPRDVGSFYLVGGKGKEGEGS